MGSEVWWGALRGSSVQPGEGSVGEQFDNYCCYFETQIAEIRESMMRNHIKTTKKVTTETI